MTEEGVLHNSELDALFEARTAELGSIFSIQAGDIRNVEIRILLELG